jgi:hypothetical protein
MELEKENINFNFKNPQEYINKLNELNGGVNLLLDDFKQNYINAKMNPFDEEMQQRYENVNSNITRLQANLFSMSNDIQININTVNDKMLEFNNLIRYEKDKSKTMEKKLGIVEDKNDSSLEMISDYREIYNIKYLRNWGLFLSTVVFIFTINSLYKKPIV